MKRRISKMKMKQRKAEEKRQATVDEMKINEAPMKSENLPRTDEGKVVYSKFDFIVKDKKKKLSKAERREKFTGKDYKSLLNKVFNKYFDVFTIFIRFILSKYYQVQKRDEKLKELKDKEPEKAKKMEEDIKWNRAISKAAGIKVKDNVELLKKGLKNKQKIKEKRIDKWQKRNENVKSNQAVKQDKRKVNLQKRIDEKKKKKMQILRRKGRIL
uniref:SURF6 domain-containing protein n=1 Tax=Heterorhabditis bacteriophora TaxID=37862 RepID=A0A1I7XUW1_HETBA